MDFHNKETDELVKAFISLKSEEECYKFLEDVCTVKEILDMSQRLHVAEMLSEKSNYQKIAEVTKASTATISRVNKCYMYGEGYKLVVERLKAERNGN